MKKFILASVAAIGMFGIAACSDSGTDNTTTQSTNPPATEQTAPSATPTAPDSTETMKQAPETGAGGEMQPAPVQPAPAQ